MAEERPDLFKALVWDSLVKAGLAALFAAAPFLAWGPLGWVVTYVVTKYADQLYAVMAMAVALEKILLKNLEHQRAFELAQRDLTKVFDEKGTESPEFKQAREAHAKALSRFVRFAS